MRRRRLELAAAVLLAALSVVLFGMGRRLPSLEERLVVVWRPGDCGEGRWVAERDYGLGGGWQEITPAPRPREGSAFALLVSPRFRACCVFEEGRYCQESKPGAAPFPVEAIYDLQIGRAYGAKAVAAWNSANGPAAP